MTTLHHDWPVKKAMVNLPVRLKGNLKCISGNLLSPVRAQNKAFGAASQMLLSRVRLQYGCSVGKVFESKCSLKTLLYVWLPLLYNHYVLVVAAQLCFPKKSAISLSENYKTWKLDTPFWSGWDTYSTLYMYYHGLVIKVGFHCTF